MNGRQKTDSPQPSIRFAAFGGDDDFLFELLELKAPLRQRLHGGTVDLSKKESFRQLRYLCQYVRDLDCKSVVLEMKYVDRHFIEDYGAFYARMFSGCSNHCRRLHFFRLPPDKLQKELQRVRETAVDDKKDGTTVEVYRNACRKFSGENYLGFSVIRPLRGAPMGRTVVKTYAEVPKAKTHRRRYPAVHLNKVHLLGVELSVDGIAFQEQDGGVSACATTAIWSSIHYLKGSESIPVPTPAEITRLAGRMVSPSGRTFPSEGLTVEQMCIALQSLRLTPCVIKAVRLGDILPILHSAVSSEMAPILVMRLMVPEEKKAKKSSLREESAIYHSVTVTGLKMPWKEDETALPAPFAGAGYFEPGNLTRGLYLHDDRRGPYMTAEVLTDKPDSELHLKIGRDYDGPEMWFVEKLLIPMYPRINLSFTELHDLGLSAISLTQVGESQQKGAAGKNQPPKLECRFIRGHKYVESCLFNGQGLKAEQIGAVCERLALPRYAGLITVVSGVFGQADILIDSTTTGKNLQALAVVPRSPRIFLNLSFCRRLAELFDTQALAC